MDTPPHIDGVMVLTEAQSQQIKANLLVIQNEFVSTDEQPVCDTFYLVSAYNKSHVGAEINGDTAEFILR